MSVPRLVDELVLLLDAVPVLDVPDAHDRVVAVGDANHKVHERGAEQRPHLTDVGRAWDRFAPRVRMVEAHHLEALAIELTLDLRGLERVDPEAVGARFDVLRAPNCANLA